MTYIYNLIERLLETTSGLRKNVEYTSFAGEETYVRVKAPNLLLGDLEEAANALRELQENIERLTSPEYLEAKLNQVGVVDSEWQKRATALQKMQKDLNRQGDIAEACHAVSMQMTARAEAAEARVKELEADVGALKFEREGEDNGKEDLGRLLGLTEEFRWKRMRYAINELVRERDEALKALEPFAKAASAWSPEENDGHVFEDGERIEAEIAITVGHLRRARDVREKIK